MIIETETSQWKVTRVIDRLIGGARILSVVALFCMFLTMIMEVFGRSFFNHPFWYTIDVAELMVLVLFYAPLAWIARINAHVRVDLLTKRVPGRFRSALDMAAVIAGLFWSGLMTGLGCIIVVEGLRDLPVTLIARLPLYPFLFLIPLGGAMLFFAFLLDLGCQLGQLVSAEKRQAAFSKD